MQGLGVAAPRLIDDLERPRVEMVVGAEARLGVVGPGNSLFAVFVAVEAAPAFMSTKKLSQCTLSKRVQMHVLPFVELVSADGQRVDVAIGPGLGQRNVPVTHAVSVAGAASMFEVQPLLRQQSVHHRAPMEPSRSKHK